MKQIKIGGLKINLDRPILVRVGNSDQKTLASSAFCGSIDVEDLYTSFDGIESLFKFLPRKQELSAV
jgi:hypothetical protein